MGGGGRRGRGREGRRRGEEELGVYVYVQHLYYNVMITSTNDSTQITHA